VPADLVELGAVRGAYGVKGWARIQPFDAEAAVLRSAKRWWLQDKGRVTVLDVAEIRRHGALLLVKWQGWDVPEAIDALRGAAVAVPRAEFPSLPAGEHYWSDLVGAQVINRDGVQLGTVQALANNGAHDLLQVEGSAGTMLVPLVPAYVDSVDVAARVIRVDWQPDWT
jgi:16S rRNA processing protein RimM